MFCPKFSRELKFSGEKGSIMPQFIRFVGFSALLAISTAVFPVWAKNNKTTVYITDGQEEKAEPQANAVDPLESVNRPVFKFNDAVDRAALEPVAKGYRSVTSQDVRTGVRNALDNLGAPNQFLNSVLQGDAEAAFGSFWRFAINTTLGLGGLVDVASQAGLQVEEKDFGQTLGMYGVESGPYIVVPLLGPSNPRDLVGEVVDGVTNPFNYLAAPATVAIRVSDVVTQREKLLDTIAQIRETSFDPYSTIRSGYEQRRKHAIEQAKQK